MVNYYELLEIASNASNEVIKAAYKALIKKYHPDNGELSGEKIRLINEAYTVLSNPRKREEYDLKLHSLEQNRMSEESSLKTNTSNEFREEKIVSFHSHDFWSKVVCETVKGVCDAIERRKAEIDNVYIEASKMPDYFLIEEYKNSRGAQRCGYARALEERGFLRRNGKGGWSPTEKYLKYY